MRSHLVSFQAYNEEQMLHHLQNIQLGSFDDVYADNNRKQLVFMDSRHILIYDMAYMGIVCFYISGKVLGKQQYGTQMFWMYR